eukprot:7918837-Pyramimonas_sp.AAC.1
MKGYGQHSCARPRALSFSSPNKVRETWQGPISGAYYVMSTLQNGLRGCRPTGARPLRAAALCGQRPSAHC